MQIFIYKTFHIHHIIDDVVKFIFYFIIWKRQIAPFYIFIFLKFISFVSLIFLQIYIKIFRKLLSYK